MAFLGAGVGLFSSLIGAAGTVLSGFAAMQAGQYQQSIAEMNAKVAEQNAQRAIERTAIEARDNDVQTLAMLGEQESIQAASGLSLDSKSFIRTRRAARELGRRDTLNIRQAGEIEAYNYKVDAVNQRAYGDLAASQGTSSLLGSFLGGAGSLLSGASSVANPSRYTTGSKYDPWSTKARTL